MALRVVGAGLGRTGTHSLKLALEQLLGGPCYHMLELLERPQDTPPWHAAVEGAPVDWDGLLGEYVATVDWPASAFWPELYAANPGAVVLLSTRGSSHSWWASMERTIVPAMSLPVPEDEPARVEWLAMVRGLMRERFTEDLSDRDAAIAAYELHNAQVRRSVPPERLIDWQPSDGWEPICSLLDMPVPDTPFPHANTTADFRTMMELDGAHDGDAQQRPSAATSPRDAPQPG